MARLLNRLQEHIMLLQVGADILLSNAKNNTRKMDVVIYSENYVNELLIWHNTKQVGVSLETSHRGIIKRPEFSRIAFLEKGKVISLPFMKLALIIR